MPDPLSDSLESELATQKIEWILTKERADRTGQDHSPERKFSLSGFVSGQRHDEFRGNGRKHIFQEH
jgi:hypothetical protein